MKLGVGARQIALGRATVAMEGDAYALSGNPAGLASLTRISLGSQTALLSEGRRLEHLALARPMDLKIWRPGLGLSLSRFALESPIERRDTNTGEPTARWFMSSDALQLGLGSWIGDGVRTHAALGFTARYVSESVGDSNGGGMALDLGSLYRLSPGLNLGWAVQNLASQSGWSTGSSSTYARAFAAGAAGRFWGRRILASAEMGKSEVQDWRLRAGVECWVSPEMLAIRAGLDRERLSLGLGALWDMDSAALGIDYSVKMDPVVSDQLDHRFSLSYDFEP